MKTLKALLSGTLVLAALVLSGCGKSSSSNPTSVVGPYGYGNCATCSGYGQLLVTATSTDQLGEVMTLQLYTTQTVQPGYNGTYTGGSGSAYQVAAQGQIYVTNANTCGLPTGQYTIASAQPTTMYGSTLQNLYLVGSGPNSIQMQLNIYFLSPTQMQVRGVMQGQGGYQTCQLVMN